MTVHLTVFNTISHLYILSVQTEEQYVFTHDAILEAIQSGTTHIPVERVAEFIHLHLLEKNAALGGASLLQHQFELITNYRPKGKRDARVCWN